MSSDLEFVLIPRDTRLNTYSFLPPKDLLAVYRVCKIFKDDMMQNDFFKSRCLAFFQSLSSMPNFYDPFIKTVENPWKWMCFALSCKKTDQVKLLSFAEQLAQASFENFNSYLAEIVKQYQTKLESEQAALKAIRGEGEQDPNSQINQAKKLAEAAWTERDKEELENIGTALATNLQAAQDASKILNKFEEKGLMNPVMLSDEESSTALEIVSQNTVVPQLIRQFQLNLKKAKAGRPFTRLNYEKLALDHSVKIISAKIATFNEITQNPKTLQKHTSMTIFETLYLLPLMRRWKDHIPMMTSLRIGVNSAMASSKIEHISLINDIFNTYSEGISNEVWHELHHKCANGEKNWKLSEMKHVNVLSQIIPTQSDLLKINSCQKSDHKEIIADFVRSMNGIQQLNS